MDERTEEDGVKKEERMQEEVVVSEEIFFLKKNLQDADGNETMSDEESDKRGRTKTFTAGVAQHPSPE